MYDNLFHFLLSAQFVDIVVVYWAGRAISRSVQDSTVVDNSHVYLQLSVTQHIDELCASHCESLRAP